MLRTELCSSLFSMDKSIINEEGNNNPFEIVDFIKESLYINNASNCSFKEIYHYTNLNIARSIINNQCLWLMKHDEDTQEHTEEEIMCFYNKAVIELSNQLPNRLLNLLKTIKINRQYLFFGSVTSLQEGVAYMACFSKEYNSEILWTRFNKAKSNMGMLSFSFIDLFEHRIDGFNNCKLFFQELIYEDDAKIKRIKDFITKLISKVKSEETIVFCVQTFLNICKFSFKPLEHSDESEVRLILILDKEKSDLLDASFKGTGAKTHFSFHIESYDFSRSLITRIM